MCRALQNITERARANLHLPPKVEKRTCKSSPMAEVFEERGRQEDRCTDEDVQSWDPSCNIGTL